MGHYWSTIFAIIRNSNTVVLRDPTCDQIYQIITPHFYMCLKFALIHYINKASVSLMQSLATCLFYYLATN